MYKIIHEGQKSYILVSQVPEYMREYFGTSFGIPSYRTIRYYVTKGKIRRPKKLGRETYFELSYILAIFRNMFKVGGP